MMRGRRLAAWLDSYGLDLRASLSCANEQGFRWVQGETRHGDLRPSGLSATGRRHLRNHVQGLGLGLDALSASFPGAGLADPACADERLQHFRQMLELGRELQVGHLAVTLSASANPGGEELRRELLRVVADLSDRAGIVTVIHDPAGPPEAIAADVRVLRCPQLRVAADTATIRPGTALDSATASLLGDVYLRDVRRRGGAYEEVAWGTGDVDFARVLGALATGPGGASLVVRRESPAAVDALRQGREYIETLIGRTPAP